MFRSTRTLLTAVAALVLAVCSDTPRAPTALVQDSAGVRIVSYDVYGVAVPTYRDVSEHDLEIGAREGSPAFSFSRIRDVAVASDGSILVSDAASHDLRVFDLDGRFRRSIGQAGEGPGEFVGAPVISDLAKDTIFAYDNRIGRLSTFTMDGTLLGTARFVTTSGTPFLDLVRQGDGAYLGVSRWVDPGRGPPTPHDVRLERDSVVIERLSREGLHIDTVRILPDGDRARIIMEAGDGRISVVQADAPFSPRAFLRSDGVRPVTGYSGIFELELGGTSHSLLRVLGAANPATAEDIRLHQESQLLEDFGDREVDPRTRRLNIEFLPERLPAFAAVEVDADGAIWVARSELGDSNGYHWLVFSKEGVLRGRVHTPPGMRLTTVRPDFVVGIVTDDFDVPYVRRYPLVIPGPAA